MMFEDFDWFVAFLVLAFVVMLFILIHTLYLIAYAIPKEKNRIREDFDKKTPEQQRLIIRLLLEKGIYHFLPDLEARLKPLPKNKNG